MFQKFITTLRWLGVRLLVAAIAWTILYTAANWYLTRERDRDLEWFTAHGIPTYPEQFTKPEVAAGDDAGPLWRAAAELAKSTGLIEGGDSGQLAGDLDSTKLVNGQLVLTPAASKEPRPLTADELARLRKALDDDRAILDLLSQAAARPKYDSPIDYRQGIATLLPHLGQAMRLAKFVRLAAEVSVYDGQLDRAIGYWSSLKALRRWSADEPNLMCGLVASTIDSQLCISIQRSLASATLNERELARVAALLEPMGDYRDRFRRAVFGEMAIFSNAFIRDWLGGRDPRFGMACSRPGAAGLLRLWLLVEQRAALRYYRDLDEDLKGAFTSTSIATPWRSVPWYALMTQVFIPSLRGAYDGLAKAQALDQVTASGVALRRQKLATGSYPASLADLKPEFAKDSGQPTDPFTNQPLVYRRRARGSVLYSVGPNQRDNGGQNWREGGPAGSDDIAFDLKD